MSADRSAAPPHERRLLPIADSAKAAILALNNEHATELSWLDADRLASLLRQAFYARRLGDADAFLIAFDEGITYDSPKLPLVPPALSTVRVRGSHRCGAAAAGSRLRTPALCQSV